MAFKDDEIWVKITKHRSINTYMISCIEINYKIRSYLANNEFPWICRAPLYRTIVNRYFIINLSEFPKALLKYVPTIDELGFPSCLEYILNICHGLTWSVCRGLGTKSLVVDVGISIQYISSYSYLSTFATDGYLFGCVHFPICGEMISAKT